MTIFNNKGRFNLAGRTTFTSFCDLDSLADAIADPNYCYGQLQVPIEEGLNATKKVIQKEVYLCNKNWYVSSPIERYYMLRRHVDTDVHYIMDMHIIATIDNWID